ncbi:MAG: exodeoxyribonuclease V subunit gamma, partial [Propionibacteriaceae bacterium]
LRVRLADRALRQLNPLLAALSRVLGLADSRMEASALLDLCAFAPVAHKFSFSSDDLERLQDLVTRSGVRWGLDAEHRQAYAMGRFAQNTWAAGLDRLLLGVTMDEAGQQFIGTALPLDDVDSSDVELVGRLAELLSRLRSLTVRFTSARPLDQWIALCRETIELLTAVPAADSWQTAHAYAALGTLSQAAADEGHTELSLVELQALLAETFRGRASRANFRTGTLTMCTMMPMRSVPHRVICLLGVDDGVFPRRSSRDGDDILAAEPWIGDRDPRSEDRQLLLDAVMAAQEHLLVIYSGADARTRAPRPPAVPIGALLDAIDVTMAAADGRPLRDHVVTAHPLQPFDPKNFQPGRLTDRMDRAFSFDSESLHGARAAMRPRVATQTRYDTDRLPPVELPDVVALPDLIRFFGHPVKALLRNRASLGSGWDDGETEDQIPVALDSLQAWNIGTRMLEQHLEGTDLGRLSAAEWRRGSLPPQQFGERTLRPVRANVEEAAGLSEDYLVGPRSSVDVLVPLTSSGPGAHTLAGTLTSVYGERLVRVNYSWLGPKHRLQAWIELLALTASHPDRSWQAVTIGRKRRSLLGPVPATWAGLVLSDLVELYRTGLSEPLALAPKVASEYARIRYQDKSIANFADKLDQLWGEERDADYESVFGAGVKWATLMGPVSIPAEERGSLAEPSRLGSLARRVWHPLLASEVLG